MRISPTPNPAPGAGNFLGAVFRGEGPEKPHHDVSPLPHGQGAGGWVFRPNRLRACVKLYLGLSMRISPTPNPAPGRGTFWVQFFGAKAPKNRTMTFPPSPREGGRGMGFPTKPAKGLCKAVLGTIYVDFPHP